MALHDWLARLKQYGENVAHAYMNGAQETSGIPGELHERQKMNALGQQALVPTDQMVAPAPMMQPYAPAQSGYQPIGGANALDQLYQGHPPDLRKPRYSNQGVTTKQDSGPGF